METVVPLPGGSAVRTRPAGLEAGAPLTRIAPPRDAVELSGDDLARAEEALLGLLGSEVAAVTAVGGYLAAAGGKRLRPMLTSLGARAAGLRGDVSRLMCVGEMIHLGSLLHDDVVDDGPERRGKPAAQRVYGNAVVILTGDFCLARAVLLASEEGGHAVVTALARAVTEMAEGEVLQLQRAGNLDTSREDYLAVVDKKSAALIAWCCAAGAHVLDDAEVAAGLEAYGRAVGVAFQITDDVLDYAGDRRLTGKAAGGDLRERKLTLPLLYALERVPDLRERLAEPPSEADIPALLASVRSSGAIELALHDARQRVAVGLQAVSALPATRHRDALVRMGRFLVERTA